MNCITIQLPPEDNIDNTNLHASIWSQTKDATESRWLHQPFEMLASPKTRTKGGGNHVYSFMPSPSRYGRKREGHPFMERNKYDCFNNLI